MIADKSLKPTVTKAILAIIIAFAATLDKPAAAGAYSCCGDSACIDLNRDFECEAGGGDALCPTEYTTCCMLRCNGAE